MELQETQSNSNIIKLPNITRVEVINHSGRGEIGRVFTDYKAEDIEIHFQDEGRTLKIFINK